MPQMRVVLFVILILAGSPARAALLDPPSYGDFVSVFYKALQASKAYSSASTEGREVALRGGAAWFLNFYCKEAPQLKSGENVLSEYGMIGQSYLTDRGNMYTHVEAYLMVLGLLIHSTPHSEGVRNACRLAREIVGK
jgi:hypothetical protein